MMAQKMRATKGAHEPYHFACEKSGRDGGTEGEREEALWLVGDFVSSDFIYLFM